MEKILLDTNILIYREDNTIVDTKVTKLFRLLYDSDDLKIYIHPMSFKDMQRQKDEELRAITLSKINTYLILENPPIATEGFHNLVGCKRKPNDEIDKVIMFKHYMTLDKPISFKDLIGNKIINGSIQSITKVDTDKMKDLVERES